jgi:glycerophosphoryl diester phosphodiesterase
MHAPLIIAHRGDSSRALENSTEAVRLALSLPADMIEIDIRKSRDNVLYVMHDKDTGRTADRDINIEQSTSGEIALVRLKNGEPIPTLDDVLRLVGGRVGLNIEIKSDGAGVVLSRHLFHYRYSGYILVSSFRESEVRSTREVMLDLPLSVIFDAFSLHDLPAYAAQSYGIVSLKKKTVNEELIKGCHERKIKVYVWTVDEEDEIKKFITWGVDGIYSNKPAVLKRLVEEHSKR